MEPFLKSLPKMVTDCELRSLTAVKGGSILTTAESEPPDFVVHLSSLRLSVTSLTV